MKAAFRGGAESHLALEHFQGFAPFCNRSPTHRSPAEESCSQTREPVSATSATSKLALSMDSLRRKTEGKVCPQSPRMCQSEERFFLRSLAGSTSAVLRGNSPVKALVESLVGRREETMDA